MTTVWVQADPWNKELVTEAIEGGADAVVVPQQKSGDVKALGIIQTVSADGDLQWDRDVVRIEIRAPEDQERILQLSRDHKVVVTTPDWRIIPLENLVARTNNIFVEVGDLQGAETALGILEKGVDGVILNSPHPGEIKALLSAVRSEAGVIPLQEVVIEALKPVGMGDRACVDTCSVLAPGEGMLVGNSSAGLFLVHAESIENPYAAPRPFRVNAGAVHAYIRTQGDKTRYLSELTAGDVVSRVDARGNSRPVIVGRVKIERRPLLLITAQGAEGPLNTIVQNAETIRLVRPDGEPVSVVHLCPGDRVMAAVDRAGRHFGHRISETITER